MRAEGRSGAYPLLELLVDGIQCILDCHALEVPCNDLESQWEVQVNLLDWWLCEHLLQDVLVFNR